MTWGQTTDTLQRESRFPSATCDALRALGHEIELLQPYALCADARKLGSWMPVFDVAITLDIATALLAIALLKPARRRYLG